MSKAGGRRSPEPESATATATRAAATLWILLALLAAARAVLTFTPGMAPWGMNVMRFLPPWIAWGTWVLMALPLIPAVGRRVARMLGSDSEPARTPWLPWLAAGAAVLMVFLLPDRTMYVGDFLLRQGAVIENIDQQAVFRQALPLDQVIHHQLPRWLFVGSGADPNFTARVIGLIDAGILAWIATLLPRLLGLAGAAALATTAITFFGGYLVLFTGYGKAVVELGLLTVAIGVAGLRISRTGRGILALGLALSLALQMHRSGVALLPAAIFCWVAWFRDPRARELLSRPATWIGLALPVVALALVAPKVVRTLIEVDLPVHLAPAQVRTGGLWYAAIGGLRLLDFGNILILFSPLVALVPAGAVVLARDSRRARELALLLLLVLPGLIVMPFLHPVQGMFRDWDNFVATGMALSLLAAWSVGELLRAAPRWAWVGLAAALGAAVPATQWLVHHSDPDRGAARMRAFVDEPPTRTESERALALDFLGITLLRQNRNVQAADTFREAVAVAPSPRFYLQWAMAETEAGNLAGAMAAYAILVEKLPDYPPAWRGYTAMASRMQKWPEAKLGATRLLELVPGDPESLALLEAIERQGLLPDSARVPSN